MKRILVLCLALCLIFGLCACAGNPALPTVPNSEARDTEAAPSTQADTQAELSRRLASLEARQSRSLGQRIAGLFGRH